MNRAMLAIDVSVTVVVSVQGSVGPIEADKR